MRPPRRSLSHIHLFCSSAKESRRIEVEYDKEAEELEKEETKKARVHVREREGGKEMGSRANTLH